MGALLDIRELTVQFDAVEAVRGVSLSAGEGEVPGLVGESGSGKRATALDFTVQAQILKLLADLQREWGLAMLFISHDLAVVGQVAGQLAVMRGGEVVETGDCGRVLAAPQYAYTRTLLAAVPTLRADRARPLATLDK
jgi:ABC-type dipeptide/oligopeptide/nickel transport system ATPase component